MADLRAIRGWYTQPGAGRAAEAKLKAIAVAIQGLVRHPCFYRLSEHRGRREMIVQGHRVLYRLLPDTGSNQTAGDVEVLRVFGPGQDIT